MKPGLKRIEATLSRLDTQRAVSSARPTPAIALRHHASSSSPSFSFTLKPPTTHRKPSGAPPTIQSPPVPALPAASTALALPAPTSSDTVQPFPAQDHCPPLPALPKFKLPSFSNHRHATNPNLVIGLLKEFEEKVVHWQTELQQTLQKIQDLYLEGPIVDGWLESSSHQPDATVTAKLRHAEIEHLMHYVQEICDHPQVASKDAIRADYRLCGLDTDGQFWSRPCPPEQLPYVSLAIARYQKLRQLLGRKQILENRLEQLAKTLINVHSQIQEPKATTDSLF